jgi:CDGSH-type Zn-finger protein/uncharacterized Fe-S cluster protein YjdI
MNNTIEEPEILVAHREQLAYLLSEAAEIEHGLMCCYLYAAFSLKRGVAEGLTPDEAAATDRWRLALHEIAREEMLHLALVSNVSTAIGMAPHLLRPNFPVWPGYHPSGVTLSLARFDRATLDHFVYMERPEGVDAPDGAGFVSGATYKRLTPPGRLMPNAQDYATVGHLYRGIQAGLRTLSARLGEAKLFCGDPRGQADERVFALEGLSAVHDLATAEAAIERIVAQGEGTSSCPDGCHYVRFRRIRDEYDALCAARPGFDPARPVARNPVMRMPTSPEDRVFVDAPQAAAVLDLANALYTMVVRLLGRIFGPTDELPDERRLFARLTVDLMQAMSAASEVLTRLPASAAHPGITAGVTFATSRSLDALPQPEAARRLFCERAHELADGCEALARDVSAELAKVAARLRRVADRLAAPRAPAPSPPAIPAPAPAALPVAAPAAAPAAPAKDADGVERVRGSRLVLSFDGKKCIHARHCVLGGPTVFLANVPGPWIHPDAASLETVVSLAHACPSGAITYERTDGGPDEPVPTVNALRIRENGPYGFAADLRVDGAPPAIRATLCRCGASKNKPYCDGSHTAAGFSATGEPATVSAEPLAARGGPLEVAPQPNGPLLVTGNLEICAGTGRVVHRATSARLCRCGGSARKPFCDGSHARIGFTAD